MRGDPNFPGFGRYAWVPPIAPLNPGIVYGPLPAPTYAPNKLKVKPRLKLLLPKIAREI